MDIQGIPCIISDTAGLRNDSDDLIEQEGMKRSRDVFYSSQIRLFLVDINDPISIQVRLHQSKSKFGFHCCRCCRCCNH